MVFHDRKYINGVKRQANYDERFFNRKEVVTSGIPSTPLGKFQFYLVKYKKNGLYSADFICRCGAELHSANLFLKYDSFRIKRLLLVGLLTLVIC